MPLPTLNGRWKPQLQETFQPPEARSLNSGSYNQATKPAWHTLLGRSKRAELLYTCERWNLPAKGSEGPQILNLGEKPAETQGSDSLKINVHTRKHVLRVTSPGSFTLTGHPLILGSLGINAVLVLQQTISVPCESSAN